MWRPGAGAGDQHGSVQATGAVILRCLDAHRRAGRFVGRDVHGAEDALQTELDLAGGAGADLRSGADAASS